MGENSPIGAKEETVDKHQWHGPESQAASDYVEGRLKDSLLFEEHLEDCTRCRLDVEALRRMQGRTRTWDEEAPYQKKRLYRPLFSGLALSLPILLVLGGLFLMPQSKRTKGPQARPTSRPLSQSRWETASKPQTFQLAGETLKLGPHTQVERVHNTTLHLITGQMRLQEKHNKFTVATDQVVIKPIGTDFEVFHARGLSRVHLNSGQVNVHQLSDGRIFTLTKDQPEWPLVVIHPKLPVRGYPTAAP